MSNSECDLYSCDPEKEINEKKDNVKNDKKNDTKENKLTKQEKLEILSMIEIDEDLQIFRHLRKIILLKNKEIETMKQDIKTMKRDIINKDKTIKILQNKQE